jgi:hypothetical protein
MTRAQNASRVAWRRMAVLIDKAPRREVTRELLSPQREAQAQQLSLAPLLSLHC